MYKGYVAETAEDSPKKQEIGVATSPKSEMLMNVHFYY